MLAPVSARTPNMQHRGKVTKTTTRQPSRLDKVDIKQDGNMWQPRRNAFPHERMEEFDRYPMVTADMMRNRRERPKRVRMLLRDFIEGQEITSFWRVAVQRILTRAQIAYIILSMVTSRSKS